MSVLRTWRCLNRYCNRVFDAWEANPHCPDCGCVRVDWMPAGGHIGNGARGADKELRALADVFRLGDMNSAEAGRGAKKVATPVPAGSSPHAFGGFVANIDPAQGAQCVPVANKVKFKVKTAPGRALPPNPTFGRPTPVIEASHKASIK